MTRQQFSKKSGSRERERDKPDLIHVRQSVCDAQKRSVNLLRKGKVGLALRNIVAGSTDWNQDEQKTLVQLVESGGGRKNEWWGENDTVQFPRLCLTFPLHLGKGKEHFAASVWENVTKKNGKSRELPRKKFAKSNFLLHHRPALLHSAEPLFELSLRFRGGIIFLARK